MNTKSDNTILVILLLICFLFAEIYFISKEFYHIATWPKVQAEIIAHCENLHIPEKDTYNSRNGRHYEYKAPKAILLEYEYNEEFYWTARPVSTFINSPVGKKINIQYDPENPSKIVYIDDDDISLIIYTIFTIYITFNILKEKMPFISKKT